MCDCDSCELAKQLDGQIVTLLKGLGTGPATIQGGVNHDSRRTQDRADLKALQEARAGIICNEQDHKVTHVCL